jgi:metallo-beta-lactamase class B
MYRLLTLCLLLLGASARAAENPDDRAPLAPFQIADNLYYVGSRDLAAYLVTTPKGNILINANLATSPPLIRASIEKLGFRWSDTLILLNSQAHFDHVAGAAEILRQTHAENMVMEGDADVVESGGRTDFLAKPGSPPIFASAHVDRVLHDGDTVALGGITLTAHKTAGHTRGCTTWTLRSHLPGEPMSTLRNIVIVGGVSFWSEFHFVDRVDRPASYPGIAADFRHTFATLHALPCDIFLGAHGVYFNLLRKLARPSNNGGSVWIDPDGYKAFVDEAELVFNTALDRQLQDAKQSHQTGAVGRATDSSQSWNGSMADRSSNNTGRSR